MEFDPDAARTIVNLFQVGEGWLLAFLMVLPRIYAFVAASQLLPASAVPRLARTAVIMMLALPITPIVQPLSGVMFDAGVGLYIGFFLKEYALGFLMGFCVTWLFWSVQAAGAFIDNQRGAAIASSIDPLQGHESSPLGLLFSQAFITYFFAVGGFLIITGLLYSSFEIWPVTEFIPIFTDEFPAFMLRLLDLGMRLTVIYAAPVIAVMFLAEFALAMVSRFAPQIQVFILAMPIKSGVAVILLIFYIPIMMRYAFDDAGQLELYMTEFFEILRLGRDTAQ